MSKSATETVKDVMFERVRAHLVGLANELITLNQHREPITKGMSTGIITKYAIEITETAFSTAGISEKEQAELW